MSNSERIKDIARAVIGESTDSCCDKRIDSLDLTEIILEVEEALDLIIEDEENIYTLNDLISRVDALTA